MPLHVKLVCIGLNIVTALFIGVVAIFTFFNHQLGLAAFFAAWAGVAGYSAYEMDKVRRYLNQQEARRGDLHVVDLNSRMGDAGEREDDG